MFIRTRLLKGEFSKSHLQAARNLRCCLRTTPQETSLKWCSECQSKLQSKTRPSAPNCGQASPQS